MPTGRVTPSVSAGVWGGVLETKTAIEASRKGWKPRSPSRVDMVVQDLEEDTGHVHETGGLEPRWMSQDS